VRARVLRGSTVHTNTNYRPTILESRGKIGGGGRIEKTQHTTAHIDIMTATTTSSSSSSSSNSSPHGIKFRYDRTTLSSCANSRLVRSLPPLFRRRATTSGRDGNDDGREDDEGGRRSSVGGGGAGDALDCRTLFVMHSVHYDRPGLTDEETWFWDAWTTTTIATRSIRDGGGGGGGGDDVDDGTRSGGMMGGEAEDGGGERRPDDNAKRTTTMSPRIEAFLRSVAFVHGHNEVEEEDDDDIPGGAGAGGKRRRRRRHLVALNRFSDVPPRELPLMTSSSSSSSHPAAMRDDVAEDNATATAPVGAISPLGMRYGTTMTTTFVILDDDESIVRYGEMLSLGRSSRDDKYHLPPTLSSRSPRGRSSSSQSSTSSSSSSFLDDGDNDMVGLYDDDTDRDRWDRHLDWSTDNNPDGVSIVHDAMDQGSCGSCWAVSATGTIEASIARNMAYVAYEDAYSSYYSSGGGGRGASANYGRRRNAVEAARRVERKAIETADLSVQELIDCDTRYDQGCAGGNPLLAYYFLRRYGVTSARNYPYTGRMDTCKYRKVDEPVATVRSWGILTADHENNIEKVRRYGVKEGRTSCRGSGVILVHPCFSPPPPPPPTSNTTRHQTANL
jgi:hypothetical protein